MDECAGLDALVTHRVWDELGYPPETTLHDLRWGEEYGGEYVWVFEISGAAPPAHFIDGYAGASSERQPPMYFRLGGERTNEFRGRSRTVCLLNHLLHLRIAKQASSPKPLDSSDRDGKSIRAGTSQPAVRWQPFGRREIVRVGVPR